jgi:mRNA interferase MazF
VEPNERNGLRSACRLMVDKITTVPNAKIGAHVGRLDDEDMVRLNQAAFAQRGVPGSIPRWRRGSPPNYSPLTFAGGRHRLKFLNKNGL